VMERIDRIREMLLQQPEDNFLQHALALELIKAGDDEGAAKIFKRLLEKDPSYVGSYYHLAKILERQQDNEAAETWYQRGMLAAQAAGDQHSYNELRSAFEELTM
jgi:Tfp pilus assembly protein PilF